MDTIVLFATGDLRAALEQTARKVTDRLNGWDHDALLRAPEPDVIDTLVDEGSVRCPSLQRDRAIQLPATEVTQTGYDAFFESRFTRRITRLILVVPFEGERVVFELRAGRYTFNPPRVLALNDAELRLAIDDPPDDPDTVRTQFNEQIDKIDTHLAWSREQIETHNQSLRAEIPTLISSRRQQLLKVRNLQAAIGFPMRRRQDADTYAAPIKRRRLRPARPPVTSQNTPFKPEPTMVESDYQAALAVLRSSRNQLERTPSLAEKLREEQIRDLLLLNLNGHFEGDAAGEVFNGAGKTDILIRVGDHHIFIGECKVWAGPKTIDDALAQLFGYLVWRDIKAAILLFVRTGDVTEVVRKATAKIEQHPNYKRRGSADTDEQIDFVMHAQGDPEREIHLALLPFALRGTRRK